MTEERAETTLAFSYLCLFRRAVVSLAVLGAVLAWAYQLPALMAAFVCVGIGELLESSYYISVLRWRQRHVLELTRTRRPDIQGQNTGLVSRSLGYWL